MHGCNDGRKRLHEDGKLCEVAQCLFLASCRLQVKSPQVILFMSPPCFKTSGETTVIMDWKHAYAQCGATESSSQKELEEVKVECLPPCMQFEKGRLRFSLAA